MEEMVEKKPGFWNKLHKSKKGQVIFFVVSMIAILAVYFLFIQMVSELRKNELINKRKVVMDNDILYDIESVESVSKILKLTGWVFRLNSENIDIQVVLQPTDNSDLIVMSTKMFEREEIEEYYISNLDFGKSGFEANVNERKLNEEKTYEVQIVLKYTQISELEEKKNIKRISTGKYIYNNTLYNYNPEEFIEPTIFDPELTEIIRLGVLKAFDLQEQIWVYQYNNKLYYIMNLETDSLEKTSIKVVATARTTRKELLPEDRISYGFDHLGSYYENKEYRREGILPYQVTVIELPSDYPVTYMTVGLYDTEQEEWKNKFDIYMTDWRMYKID